LQPLVRDLQWHFQAPLATPHCPLCPERGTAAAKRERGREGEREGGRGGGREREGGKGREGKGREELREDTGMGGKEGVKERKGKEDKEENNAYSRAQLGGEHLVA